MARVTLTASDGHTLSAERIDPAGPARGGLVVVQEIFGVNAHIRAVTARFAAAGYRTIAPALFDRVERDVELGYEEAAFDRGRALVGQLDEDQLLSDLAAARAAVAGDDRVACVGYCFGGAVAWIAAAKLEGIAGAISYYGSRIAQNEGLTPKVPVQMHVGRHDASFPLEIVHRVASAHSAVEAFEYEAGHGFSCDHRADFDPDAAALALERSLGFLARVVG